MVTRSVVMLTLQLRLICFEAVLGQYCAGPSMCVMSTGLQGAPAWALSVLHKHIPSIKKSSQILSFRALSVYAML